MSTNSLLAVLHVTGQNSYYEVGAKAQIPNDAQRLEGLNRTLGSAGDAP